MSLSSSAYFSFPFLSDYLHDIRYARSNNSTGNLFIPIHPSNRLKKTNPSHLFYLLISLSLLPISEALSRLQTQLNIALILLIVVLTLLAISHGIRLFRWCRGRGFISTLLRKLQLKKKKRPAEKTDNLTHANPHTKSPKVQLRDVPVRHQINRESTVFSIDGAASTIQTVSTPISTRYPAEDSTTTVNFSYDNAGLAVTPTIPDRPRTEQGMVF